MIRPAVLLVLALAACSAALTGSLLVWALAACAAVWAVFLSADGLVTRVEGQPLDPDHVRRRNP